MEQKLTYQAPDSLSWDWKLSLPVANLNCLPGPTAIMSMMIYPHVSGNPDYAVLMCFLSGCIILLLGLLNLGVLVRYISVPVTAGFTLAAALTVGSGQINNLFGIQSKSNEFLSAWINFFGHIQETRRNDAILGCGTLILLLIMRVSQMQANKMNLILILRVETEGSAMWLPPANQVFVPVPQRAGRYHWHPAMLSA